MAAMCGRRKKAHGAQLRTVGGKGAYGTTVPAGRLDSGLPSMLTMDRISPGDTVCNFSDRPCLQYASTGMARQSGCGRSQHKCQLWCGLGRRKTSTPMERWRPAPKCAQATSLTSDPSSLRRIRLTFVTKSSILLVGPRSGFGRLLLRAIAACEGTPARLGPEWLRPRFLPAHGRAGFRARRCKSRCARHVRSSCT